MKLLRIIWVTSITFPLIWSCTPKAKEVIPEPIEAEIDPGLAIRWADLTLVVIKNSPNNSPTYASRSLGYLGLSMYEAAVQGSIVYQSIAPSLNGLGDLPKSVDSLTYDWELSVNSAQAVVLKNLYPHAPKGILNKIDSLNQQILAEKRDLMLSEDIIKRSSEFGIAIASKIIQWSLTDGGHKGYEFTFDRNYRLKIGTQYWTPPRAGQSSVLLPMHPYWGSNRTFLSENNSLSLPEMKPFSQVINSAYYEEMKIVYLVQLNLDQKGKENAIWWGDDPESTVSPPGHSYYITKKLVEQENITLFEAAAVFAKVGMSVADSFINCWKCKYKFSAERPTPYIRRVFDHTYSQFWPEPPFPAFTSGHSTQAASAATSLISVFGDNTSFTDDLHANKRRDVFRNVEYKTRSFRTIWEMAEECGYSRIEGGIHTPQDNKVGLNEGKKIGTNVVSLPWKVTVDMQ